MLKICECCKTEFDGKPNQKCCSRGCSSKVRHKKNIVMCDNCGCELYLNNTELNYSKKHYCSNKCKGEHQKIINVGENNSNYKSKVKVVNCDYCAIEYRRYDDGRNCNYHYCSQECKAKHQSDILIGENNPNYKSNECKCFNCKTKLFKTDRHKETRLNIFCSKECWYQYMSKNLTGENNWNYNKNISDEERYKTRGFPEYSTWRNLVFKRDNYTCVCCGYEKGNIINAHHLDGYNWCIEKRTDVDNGATLCKECHFIFHSIYGFGDNTKEQFLEFINYTNTEENQEIKEP